MYQQSVRTNGLAICFVMLYDPRIEDPLRRANGDQLGLKVGQ